MEYQDIPELSREEYKALIDSDDSDKISVAILGLAMYHENLDDIYEMIKKHLISQETNIRASAVEAIGHLARRFSSFNKESLLDLLVNVKENESDSFVLGKLNDAEDDIIFFLK